MTIFHQIKSDTQQIKAVRLRSEINNSPYTQAEFLDILLTGNSLDLCAKAAKLLFEVLIADRKSTRLNSSHKHRSRMPSSA